MRIIYMLTSLGMGGAERQAVALAERMAERVHVVKVLVLMPRQPEEWPTSLDVVYLNLRKNPLSLLASLTRGHRVLRDFHPDLVHSHCFHANLAARLLKLSMPQAAILSTVHNVYEGGWLRMLAYRLSDGLSLRTAAVSQAAADRFVRLKAIPQKKCIVMPNGIDAAEFTPNAERRLQMCAEMRAQADFIWLAVGRLAAAKDYPNLLRAFVRLRMERADARLWIAGEGTGAEAEAIRALAVKLNLEDAVCWLGLRRDLPALLDAADGFVLASSWEGMPLALGEAMAMEMPVVATDVGGVRELVGETCLLVPAKSSQSLADAMLGVMRRTELERRTMGQEARERIEKSFSIEARANEWETLYRKLLRKPA